MLQQKILFRSEPPNRCEFRSPIQAFWCPGDHEPAPKCEWSPLPRAARKRAQRETARASVLPTHFELVIYRSHAIDGAERFLSHLLFEKTFDATLQDQMPPVGPQKYPTLVEVRVTNNQFAGKSCQLGRI